MAEYFSIEFQNWFMKNGILINQAPSLFDSFESTGKSELEILRTTDSVKTKKIKELRQKVKILKNPPLEKIELMVNDGTLDDWIDKNCRLKNGKLNLRALGRELGCDGKTAKNILQSKGLCYLYDDSKNTYLE